MRSWLSLRSLKTTALFAAVYSVLALSAYGADPFRCYDAFFNLRATTLTADKQIVKSFDSNLPIARAFEKEGLLYSDIAQWFDSVDKTIFAKRMNDRLEKEKAFGKKSFLFNFLDEYPTKYVPEGVTVKTEEWAKLSREDQVKFFTSAENPFSLINVQGRENLFYDNVLNFDDVRSSGITPKFLTVGDDLGSYEVRSVGSEADRVKYLKDRQTVETGLEAKVGHQHFFHGWSKDKATREKMVGQYLENLDATSWFLYWRQIKRNPDEVKSLLFHPYLGVYERDMLDRLAEAFVEGKPEKFNQKYRTMGARAFKPREGSETDGWSRLTDFEQRSGNTGSKRDFIADVMEARLSSGDYSGMKDFRSYDFNASSPSEKLFSPWLKEKEIGTLEKFEAMFPNLEYKDSKRAYNHFRNRVLAPMLPWENRLDIDYKKDVLKRAQKRFAKRYLEIAEQYLKKAPKLKGDELAALREEVRSELERINYLFARRLRLDVDLEHYLMPQPTKLPEITVKSDGPIDVNQTPIGIETSHRFAFSPKNKKEAEMRIRRAAESFAKEIDAVKVTKVEDGGHGHGLSVRYIVTDKQGRDWRVEWDGVQRSYDAKGNAINPHGGHIEAPTPKIQPQDMTELAALYRAMRKEGNYPKRSAGGAHFNMGLEQLQQLSSEEAASRMANFTRVFEKNRTVIQALFQHPFRERVAIPVPYGKEFVDSINDFKGDWGDLQYLFYNKQYFNPFVTRKPAYIQMNTTGLMNDVVPEAYKKTIDIKKAGIDDWFPSFSKGGNDRVEFRMSDAMTDEHLQALQIKFFRALANRGLNGEKVVLSLEDNAPNMLKTWRENPKQFFADSDAFLESLGLSPDEFRPLQVQAIQQQMAKGAKIEERNAARAPPVTVKIKKKFAKSDGQDESLDKVAKRKAKKEKKLTAKQKEEAARLPLMRPDSFLPAAEKEKSEIGGFTFRPSEGKATPADEHN